jgi:Zn finger protein HypA/HybF involved in hydrogenase expression
LLHKKYKRIESRIGAIKYWDRKLHIATPIESDKKMIIDWQPLDSYCKYCNKRLEHDVHWQTFPILRTVCNNCDDMSMTSRDSSIGMDE